MYRQTKNSRTQKGWLLRPKFLRESAFLVWLHGSRARRILPQGYGTGIEC
jgi:poly(3-hydroxybutyrate) depolymerase